MGIWKRLGSAINFVFWLVFAAQSLGVLPFPLPLPFREVGEQLPVITSIVALVGLTIASIWIGYQLHPWLNRLIHRKTGVPRLLELVKDGGEMKVVGSEYSRWSNESYATIKSLITSQKVKFTFLVADPQSDNVKTAIASDLLDRGSAKAIGGSLDRLRELRDSLGVDAERMQIRLFNLPLAYSMAIAIPRKQEAAEVHIWPFMYRIRDAQRPYIICAGESTVHGVTFDKCSESYGYVFNKSWEDKRPTPEPSEIVQVRETSRVREQAPIPQVMKTSDRGYDPDRAARLDPKFAGVHALFFWPKKYSWEKGERNPNINMPYTKVIIKGNEAFWWGAYAEDLFRRGKIEYNNAPGDFENEEEMKAYLRENGFSLHQQPVSSGDLLGDTGLEPTSP